MTQPAKAADGGAATAALIATLTERIEALERRLADLEREQSGPDAAAL